MSLPDVSRSFAGPPRGHYGAAGRLSELALAPVGCGPNWLAATMDRTAAARVVLALNADLIPPTSPAQPWKPRTLYSAAVGYVRRRSVTGFRGHPSATAHRVVRGET